MAMAGQANLAKVALSTLDASLPFQKLGLSPSPAFLSLLCGGWTLGSSLPAAHKLMAY